MSTSEHPPDYNRNVHDLRHEAEVRAKQAEDKVKNLITILKGRYQAFETLAPLVREYAAARKIAEEAVKVNEQRCKATPAHGKGYETPFEVLDAIKAWKLKAIEVANAMVEACK